jgi:hypothetical protein
MKELSQLEKQKLVEFERSLAILETMPTDELIRKTLMLKVLDEIKLDPQQMEERIKLFNMMLD